jgi:hypothetical protein
MGKKLFLGGSTALTEAPGIYSGDLWALCGADLGQALHLSDPKLALMSVGEKVETLARFARVDIRADGYAELGSGPARPRARIA